MVAFNVYPRLAVSVPADLPRPAAFESPFHVQSDS